MTHVFIHLFVITALEFFISAFADGFSLSELYHIWSATNPPSEIVTTMYCYI